MERRLSVTPRAAMYDVVHGGFTNAILPRKRGTGDASRAVASANSGDLRRRQNSRRVSLATGLGAVAHPVRSIRFASVPPQVLQTVVARVPVTVATLQPGRAWTHERLEDKVVHLPPTVRQADLHVAVSVSGKGFDDAGLVAKVALPVAIPPWSLSQPTPHPSLIADLVPRVAHYRPPPLQRKLQLHRRPSPVGCAGGASLPAGRSHLHLSTIVVRT